MRAFIWSVAMLIFAIARSAPALEAGATGCDITPDVKRFKVPMAGYGARGNMPAEGVHDPLHAKALYLRDGKKKMALVTLDLRSSTPELKKLVLEGCGDLGLTADSLLLDASHTHDGPAMYAEKFWQMQFGAYDPEIVKIMAERIGGALHEAAKAAQPVAVGIAQKKIEGFTRNRRWDYDKPGREAAHETPVVNPILTVIRIDTLKGEPRAVWVNFATHPTILGAKNMLISAEWPGVLQANLEKEFPGAVAFFANGAEGDQAPAGAQGADEFARVLDFGTRLGAEAAALAKTIKPEPGAKIGFGRVTPELPAITFSEGAMKSPLHAQYHEPALQGLPRQAEVQVLRIGRAVLIGLPGEPICEVGMAAADAVRKSAAAIDPIAIPIGLANDYLGYIVNEKEYPHGGYEVDTRSYYGAGLGTFMAKAAGDAAGKL